MIRTYIIYLYNNLYNKKYLYKILIKLIKNNFVTFIKDNQKKSKTCYRYINKKHKTKKKKSNNSNKNSPNKRTKGYYGRERKSVSEKRKNTR